ncbi:molybdopterin converting factor subunit 1 [Alicyclobacillus shizuokensis]|uniref:molybdopterin converting factor subunit 1 n=1 Tax=Alicyclobacillus shizuokensis TaxID=392014 RepID=UPI00082B61FB|nr:molybdopterin converting factor subunit 1 [Alicyclobacillus shizuokensis]MCL6625579.1 molybdopterin converting factor subunit 1 [Alicyclobacillus shizuokensis]
MKIRVRLFAGIAETIQQRELILNVPVGMSILQLRHHLMEQYPQANQEIAQAMMAINRSYADDGAMLHEGDEVGVIPPVSGGDALPSCVISAHPLDVAQAFHQLESVHHGGTVLFVGTVREWTHGRQTSHLEYEAYTDMALAQMKKIEDDVKAMYRNVWTLQWHRVGRLLPTEIAVICAASAPHRADAFAASRLLIDRLKKEVPIWKKEFYADGETTWQSNPETAPEPEEC